MELRRDGYQMVKFPQRSSFSLVGHPLSRDIFMMLEVAPTFAPSSKNPTNQAFWVRNLKSASLLLENMLDSSS